MPNNIPKLKPCKCGDKGYIQPVMGGSYFCVGCRYKYLIDQSYVISDTKTKLKEWLTNELPKIREK